MFNVVPERRRSSSAPPAPQSHGTPEWLQSDSGEAPAEEAPAVGASAKERGVGGFLEEDSE